MDYKTSSFIILFNLQRWKEQYFVNVGKDCGLTIAGFYYVCFSCQDGSINGYYFDPNSRCNAFLYLSISINSFVSLFYIVKNIMVSQFDSTLLCSPFQMLELKPTHEGRSGVGFSSYQLQ